MNKIFLFLFLSACYLPVSSEEEKEIVQVENGYDAKSPSFEIIGEKPLPVENLPVIEASRKGDKKVPAKNLPK
jgi:hypothetical protein